MSRDDFIARKAFGLPLIAIGDGAMSNLVKALKGEIPFGINIGNSAADFNQTPCRLTPVSDEDIAFIQKWFDEECLEDSIEVAPLNWRRTNAPVASSRTDDIWFIDSDAGWAVNSAVNIG